MNSPTQFLFVLFQQDHRAKILQARKNPIDKIRSRIKLSTKSKKICQTMITLAKVMYVLNELFYMLFIPFVLPV